MTNAVQSDHNFEVQDIMVNMGPQHPATHGVFRMVLAVDGEIVRDVIPHIGYMHRGAEKLAETMDFRQGIGNLFHNFGRKVQRLPRMPEKPTLADFSVAAPLFHAEAADFPLKPYPRIQEWFARMSALPCWRETAPQRPAG